MTDDRIETWAKQEAPTRRGWYRTAHSANWMLYSLGEDDQWRAHVLNGETTVCGWEYIEQAGAVELVAAYR